MVPRENDSLSWDTVKAASRHDEPAYTVEVCRAFLRRQPDHGPALIKLGRALTDMARFEEAKSALERALDRCPREKQDVVFQALGTLEKYRGSFAEAENWYKRAVELRANDATGYIFLGACLASQGKLAEAEECHRLATTCSEGCIDEALYNLGLVLRAQGRYREARESIMRAVEVDPAYAAATEALADVDRCLRFMPGPA